MPKATSRSILLSFYLSAAALVFLPVAVIAGDDTPKPEAPAAVEEQEAKVETPRFQSGMRVWVDPKTGEIRQPTDKERKAVAERLSVDALLNKSPEGLTVRTRPDGSKFVDLQGRFMHMLVVTRAEDGTLKAHCIDHSHQMDKEKTGEELPVR
jgi:hypothetical protein